MAKSTCTLGAYRATARERGVALSAVFLAEEALQLERMLTQLLGREYESRDLHQVGKRHATMQFSNRAFLKWLDRQKAA